MCYIQVSEHLRGQAAGTSMPQGRISSVFQEFNKTFMFPSFKWNVSSSYVVYQNKNQVYIKNVDVVTNDMTFFLWT